jgi:hypothetical protein
MKEMEYAFHDGIWMFNLYISRSLKPDLDPDDLSRILGYVGIHFPDLYEMFRKLMKPSGLLFYDMTSIISYSKNLKLAEKGYNPDHEYENQVTVIMAFSSKTWVPVAVDVDLGPLPSDSFLSSLE